MSNLLELILINNIPSHIVRYLIEEIHSAALHLQCFNEGLKTAKTS